VRPSPIPPTVFTGSNYRKRLPDLVVEPGAANLVNIDAVGEPQDVELLARDLGRLARRQRMQRVQGDVAIFSIAPTAL
jgi:hypothetical protein